MVDDRIKLDDLIWLLIEFDFGYQTAPDTFCFPALMSETAPLEFEQALDGASSMLQKFVLRFSFVPSGLFGRVLCAITRHPLCAEKSGCSWSNGAVILGCVLMLASSCTSLSRPESSS